MYCIYVHDFCLLAANCTSQRDPVAVKAAAMKMKGFTCQSHASTAVVCMAHDRRSVLVPRLRATDRSLADQAMLIGGRRKCVRLGDVKRAESTGARSFGVTYLRKGGESKDGIARNDSIAISSGQVFQVVVMRVSLHCEGCAGKLKKHLSKMEGVTSFSIELENKKVTVMGNVSPSRVLESISKSKNSKKRFDQTGEVGEVFPGERVRSPIGLWELAYGGKVRE